MNVLGVDVGTGGTRALIVNQNGRIAASSTEEHVPAASPRIGFAEQHPENWWRAVSMAIRRALADADLQGDGIACVGISGQMHGAVLLDEQGNVVRPAIIWCDVRTTEECAEI